MGSITIKVRYFMAATPHAMSEKVFINDLPSFLMIFKTNKQNPLWQKNLGHFTYILRILFRSLQNLKICVVLLRNTS